MATNIFHGRVANLAVSAASSVATVRIGRVRNFSLDASADPIEVTNFDSSGWQENIDGIKSFEFTAESLALSTTVTSQHDRLRSALSSGVRQWFNVENTTDATAGVTTGGMRWQFFGYVNSWSLAGSQDDVQVHNFGIRGDGAYAEVATTT